VAFGPQANYTDWATASCPWNLVPTFVDREVSRGQRGVSPTIVNLSFLNRSRYFSFKQLLIYSHKGWVDPVPDPLLVRKSGSAGNQSRVLWVRSQELWPLDHRGGLYWNIGFNILTALVMKSPSCHQLGLSEYYKNVFFSLVYAYPLGHGNCVRGQAKTSCEICKIKMYYIVHYFGCKSSYFICRL
jgi:hypothetical protein